MIKKMIQECNRNDEKNKMIILAGGGLTPSNIPSFVLQTGCREVHASLRGENDKKEKMVFRKMNLYMGGEKINSGEVEYSNKIVDSEKVKLITKGDQFKD